jgi:hypothetical protein
MKLTIDNLDGRGPQDYTGFIDSERTPCLVRRLNKPAELQVSLLAIGPDFVVPAHRARVMVGRANGQDVFTGYVTAVPTYVFLGYGHGNPTYRYDLVASSDEVVLDRKTIRRRFPFVGRSAGNALRQLTQDLMPGTFDTAQVQDLDTLPFYICDPQKTWTQQAAEIALCARGRYRAIDGQLIFEPVGGTVYALNEADPAFSPDGLKLIPADKLVNDVTVIGLMEPQAHVKDYFVGDGYTLKFYLSQTPFMGSNKVLLDEEYAILDPTHWTATDPRSAISVSGGKLVVAGGTGNDGETSLVFSDKVELGGTIILQHGDATFDSASGGVIGGLYTSSVAIGSCLAGFNVTPSGGQSQIQAILNGSLTGPVMNTQGGHRYVFTTRILSTEVYRQQQVYHSSTHPAGSERGGAPVAADVRIVLEVHEIDPANPATMVAASTVLYDGIVANAPGLCTYALINAKDLHCQLTFTRITRAANAEVRSALPGNNFRTRLTGSLAEGAECKISTEPSLTFYPQTLPAPNELINVHYRGSGRALARVTNTASISATVGFGDDGIRAVVNNVTLPSPRTAADCEQAALAILDDANVCALAGTYETWSDFLPAGAADIFPGDALDVNVPSQRAEFRGIIRQVDVQFEDLDGEHSRYKMTFASDAADPLAMELSAGLVSVALDLIAVPEESIGSEFLPDLTGAEITQTTSTSVTIDAGIDPTSGYGVEVRWSDTGFGPANDRNLVGDSRVAPLRFRGSRACRIIFSVNTTVRHLPGTRGFRWRCIWIIRCHRPMKTEEVVTSRFSRDNVAGVPLVVHVIDQDFQREVLEKLGRLEANVEMLVGDGQPGRMKLAEDKIFALQKNDIRRSVYDRIVNAVIATAISIVVALHDHLGLR